jgi:hypothetical protein
LQATYLLDIQVRALFTLPAVAAGELALMVSVAVLVDLVVVRTDQELMLQETQVLHIQVVAAAVRVLMTSTKQAHLKL